MEPVGKPADNDPLVVADHLRIRLARVHHREFRLMRQEAMLGNVVDVLDVPDEFHSADYFTTKMAAISSQLGKAETV
jgi:hypothetical protein